MARPIEIAPSVLPADFARLGEEVAALEKAGVDRIQWDVMDGQFVPNLTFGPDVIAAARSCADVPFEAHLMVLTPDVMAPRYVEAGCERLIVHAEACTAPAPHARGDPRARRRGRRWRSTRRRRRRRRPRARPRRPGAGDDRQPRLRWPGTTSRRWSRRSPRSRRMVDAAGRDDDVDVEVDGGIGPATVAGAAAAGANVLVAGSALYQDPEGLEHAVADLRARAAAALA